MSVYRLRQRALEASREAREPSREVLSSDGASARSKRAGARTSADAVAQTLSTYIPHEALSLYIAVLAVLSPADRNYAGRWVAFAIGAIATPYFLALYNWLEGRRVDWRSGWVTMVFSEISFLFYMAVIPGTPYLSWGAFNTRYGLVAALVYTAAVAPVAKRLGLVK